MKGSLGVLRRRLVTLVSFGPPLRLLQPGTQRTMEELRDSLKRAQLESERLTGALHHGELVKLYFGCTVAPAFGDRHARPPQCAKKTPAWCISCVVVSRPTPGLPNPGSTWRRRGYFTSGLASPCKPQKSPF